jgi:hypothetical protein
MKCNDTICNLKVDAIERQDDVVFAYRKRDGEITASDFCGMFSLGSVDFLYITDERTGTA